MDQQINNSQNEFLWTLLANPANEAHLYAFNLQRLVNDFPQSGILQALLAHASDEKNLKQASVYFSPRSLFKLINAPLTFTGVPDERIIIQPGIGGNGNYRRDDQRLDRADYTPQPEESVESELSEMPVADHPPVEEALAETSQTVDAETAVEQQDMISLDAHLTDYEHTDAHIAADTEIAEPVEHTEPGVAEMHEATAPEEVIANELSPVQDVVDEVHNEQHEAAEVITPEAELVPVHEPSHEITPETDEHTETAAPEAEAAPAHEAIDEIPVETHEPAEITSPENEVTTVDEAIDEMPVETHEPAEIASPENEEPPVHEPIDEMPVETHEPVETETHEAEPTHVQEFSDEIHAEQEEPVETVVHEAEPMHVQEFSGEIHAEKEGPVETMAHEAEPTHVQEFSDEIHAEQEDPVENVVHETEPAPVQEFSDEIRAEQEEPVEAVVREAEAAPVQEFSDEIHAEKEEPVETVAHEAEPGPVQELIDETPVEKEEPVEAAASEAEPESSEAVAHEAVNEEPVAAVSAVHDEEHPVETPAAPVAEDKPPATQADEDIDETFDEIVGIEDINFNQPAGGQRFFSFDQQFGAHTDEPQEAGQQVQAAPTAAGAGKATQGGADHQDVSKYHDEKMPYSFMWWLDKTRKEHEQIYQPYVKSSEDETVKKPKRTADELQQQYFENIFHITSVEELDKTIVPRPAPFAPFKVKRKEQIIIDRFIKEEPQIRPQSSDKLDNENKAKKSSEDRDELVTETLAGIYSDQMLYHKAIASYKKLMLRFPEKSRYFAEKIEQLERKTN